MRDALDPLKHQRHAPALADGAREARKGFFFEYFVPFVFKIFSPENIWALVLFLIVIALIVFTSDSSPVWIYQGF